MKKSKKGKFFVNSLQKILFLNYMYCLLCIMQSQIMTKLDKIISDLGPEERKSLMEKFRKDELGE